MHFNLSIFIAFDIVLPLFILITFESLVVVIVIVY